MNSITATAFRTYRSEGENRLWIGDYKSSLPSAYNQILSTFGLPMGTDGRTTGSSLSLHLPKYWGCPVITMTTVGDSL